MNDKQCLDEIYKLASEGKLTGLPPHIRKYLDKTHPEFTLKNQTYKKGHPSKKFQNNIVYDIDRRRDAGLSLEDAIEEFRNEAIEEDVKEIITSRSSYFNFRENLGLGKYKKPSK